MLSFTCDTSKNSFKGLERKNRVDSTWKKIEWIQNLVWCWFKYCYWFKIQIRNFRPNDFNSHITQRSDKRRSPKLNEWMNVNGWKVFLWTQWRKKGAAHSKVKAQFMLNLFQSFKELNGRMNGHFIRSNVSYCVVNGSLVGTHCHFGFEPTANAQMLLATHECTRTYVFRCE